MLRYIINRFFTAIFTIWVIITFTFILMHTIPGDPFAKEGNMPSGVYNNLLRHYNLDKPKVVQYFIYLKNLARLDFGPSTKSRVVNVNYYIKNNFPVSARLGMQALIVAIAVGLVLGIIAALRHNQWPDYISMILAIIGISVPSFIMGTLLIHYAAVQWRLFPPGQWKSFAHTVLPTIALMMMPLAVIARMMRSSMLEVMNQDYIRTARSKGLSQAKVVWRHGIRNAILPVVTVLGITATNLIVGSFIIERIFSIPGMGEAFVQSVTDRDYSVILGSTVFYSAILIVLVFVVDIAYVFIDPRIKLPGKTREITGPSEEKNMEEFTDEGSGINA